MPTPTFISAASTVFNTTTSPKTLSVTVAVGDDLLVLGSTADSLTTLGTPTGGSGFTWTLLGSDATSSNCAVYLWKTTATSAQTFTLSVARAGSTTNFWGFGVIRFSGVTGYGTTVKTVGGSGAPSQAVTTVEANSTLAMVTGDWNAVTGTRTYRTVNGFTPTVGGSGEVGGFNGDGTNWGVSIGYWPDAGATGSKTVGTTAPTGQKFTIIAVEVKGTASGSNTGTLSATLPDLTTSITGTQTNLADVTDAIPRLTTTITGTQTNLGVLTDSLPVLTTTLAGSQTNPAVLNATLPDLTTSISGTATNAGALSATPPVLTSSATGSQTNLAALSAAVPRVTTSMSEVVGNPGTLNAALPVLTTVLTGTQTNQAVLNGSVPRLTTSITEAGSVNVAVLNASTPRLTTSVAGNSVNPGTLTAAIPVVSSSIPGTMTNSGVLTAGLPRVTTTLTAVQVNAALLLAVLPLLRFSVDDGVRTDITVTGTLEPRRWASTLRDRNKHGTLADRRWGAQLGPPNTYGILNDRRWKGGLR